MKAYLVCFQNERKGTVYLLLEKLPKIWNEGIPTYRLGWLIDSVIVGDTEDEKRFDWRVVGSKRNLLEYLEHSNVEPGDCYLIEVDEEDKWIRFKSWLGKYYTDTTYQDGRENVYIVRGKDPIYGSDKFVLAKSLPSRWDGDFPIYVDDQFISYINCNQEYEIVEPDDSYPYNPYTWCAAKMEVGGAAMFEKCGKKLELLSNFTANLHITCLPEAEFLDGSPDHSDCEFAGDIPPSDFLAPAEDPEDEQPTLIHAYLVCHSVNGEKHFTLMRNLPIGWTSFDSIYYNNSDVIEEVVPGCKYNFVQTNMGAYSYGIGFMTPGDAISCEIVGSRIDCFTQLDRYPVHEVVPGCYMPKDSVIDSKMIVDEVNESVDLLLPDNVNHPSHYTSHPSGVECIEITKHHDFCIGNAIKYLWRQGLKHDADKSVKEKRIEDLKKAIWYINAEIDLIEKDRQGSEL